MLSRCYVSGADYVVMAGGKVFSRVVRPVGKAGGLVVAKMSLVGAAAKLVKAHVHTL